MTEDKTVYHIIHSGEGLHVEFKRGGKGARDDVFESYCSLYEGLGDPYAVL